ncbi:MAG: 50S ribosomal protein L19e [Candidatus Woesearchaeota archaeon]|nr:MAG: 50S ribosomal protein L19e [Candidatus Woesearchaeota archaeon]
MLRVQKRLASQVLNCSPKRVWFDNDRLDDIKQAITKHDIRLLVGEGAIKEKPTRSTSKVRVRKLKLQKSKGRRKGEGTRKGTLNARINLKEQWMKKLRVQRTFLKELVSKKIITRKAYRELYLKSKGGYFRSKRHIKLFLEEHDEMLSSKSPVEEDNTKNNKTRSDKKIKNNSK